MSRANYRQHRMTSTSVSGTAMSAPNSFSIASVQSSAAGVARIDADKGAIE